jgi:hypothetical protein
MLLAKTDFYFVKKLNKESKAKMAQVETPQWIATSYGVDLITAVQICQLANMLHSTPSQVYYFYSTNNDAALYMPAPPVEVVPTPPTVVGLRTVPIEDVYAVCVCSSLSNRTKEPLVTVSKQDAEYLMEILGPAPGFEEAYESIKRRLALRSFSSKDYLDIFYKTTLVGEGSMYLNVRVG